ncbi:DUF3293 domain-containing protein [Pseudoalteromonas luteoviolacea]|uniref:Uncharacterized protein n=1 Tax=Pseudoalteromonas luteoviolacea S4054 TaxID=1129367 RepID=A0A0F6A6P3_9GAMM|nr:hypothetical protein [Pseudoalteromonas luteoviolacea]AOT10898.1 hypothetical protein S4054249_23940 [Pseudoalteromonas luteoviolacea]AOT15939.1 hypothetical protein S40542_24570 [Pseudoalteromonas luteoviolacea]AOT20719.1 hypothetical protein S4054_23860 [Pseudoalteromonas luteoviolacea]KKE81820.1 hypothetical protein N479_02345 [Pseudoalteromonas luteoviolacea S4054]KZN66222.1 hypothetical protein N481_24735 [Pseudoalteromonas luteoviolacea S4047-1]
MNHVEKNLITSPIPISLWNLYKAVYFYPFSPTNHYKHGAIISLWNSHGNILTKRENKRFQHKNIASLSRLCVPINYVFGGDHSMSYRELSISINISLRLAQKISIRFNQRAFYYLDNNRITLFNSYNLGQNCVLDSLFTSRINRMTLPIKNTAQL